MKENTIHQYAEADYEFAEKRLKSYVQRNIISQAKLDQMMKHLKTMEDKGLLASGSEVSGKGTQSNAAIYAYKMIQARQLLHPDEYVNGKKESVKEKIGGNHREVFKALCNADTDEKTLAEAAKTVAGVEEVITARGQTNLAVRSRGISYNVKGQSGYKTSGSEKDAKPGETPAPTPQGKDAKPGETPAPTPQGKDAKPGETPAPAPENAEMASLRAQVQKLQAEKQAVERLAQEQKKKIQELQDSKAKAERLAQELGEQNKGLRGENQKLSDVVTRVSPEALNEAKGKIRGDEMLSFCKKGDFESALRIIKENPNLVNYSSGISKNHTALWYAVKGKQGQIVDELMGIKGVNVNQGDKDGRTVLHVAVENKDQEMVKKLLKNGANAKKGDNINWETPVHLAARQGNLDMIQILKDDTDKFLTVSCLNYKTKNDKKNAYDIYQEATGNDLSKDLENKGKLANQSQTPAAPTPQKGNTPKADNSAATPVKTEKELPVAALGETLRKSSQEQQRRVLGEEVLPDDDTKIMPNDYYYNNGRMA